MLNRLQKSITHPSTAIFHALELGDYLAFGWACSAETAAAGPQWPEHLGAQKQRWGWGPRGGKQTRAPVQLLLLAQGRLVWRQAADAAGPQQQLPVHEGKG